MIATLLQLIFVLDADEEKVWPKMKEPKDAETQTDPEITGVDADDFEEGDYSSSGEESGSDSDSSDEEAAGTDKSKENASSSVKTSKGVGAGQVRRKNIELKYYFGEDMPDAEMQRLAEADVLVPPGLEVKESNIPNAGRGVFAKCIIPKHEFFGPYIGRIVTRKEAKTYKESPYVWEVFDDYGKLTHLIDGRDALQSNWLRYVNCSKGLDEQNLRAVQYDKNIYYMATKEIAIGEELLTYYGDKFAKKIGIKPKKSSVVPGEESFVCKNCGKMYTNPGALIGHLKFKCNTVRNYALRYPCLPFKDQMTEVYFFPLPCPLTYHNALDIA
ncbi:predicted protein [Nematostella vectensis]|uniref:SET domain-containing protein n=1 Tax=Nematostella vectensis TaxID=45351 RepID=A7RI18_NEMVE|nr:predicted protein [Nematostella vectensis]|eukprot:XP_001641018.1 predicted protein [Nematostella vectensis]